jgi:DNA-binding protein H-NS
VADGNCKGVTEMRTFDGMTVAELDALIAKAQTARQETRERRRGELKVEIEGKLKAEGFTAYEVLGAKVRPKPETLPPKYADRADPSLTWSGKGRMPAWLQGKVDAGSAIEQFRISS